MPAGDWGEGASLRIGTIRCIPDASGAIAEVHVAYEIVLPSGQVIPQSWQWPQPDDARPQVQLLGQRLLGDLLAFEGVPLSPQVVSSET